MEVQFLLGELESRFKSQANVNALHSKTLFDCVCLGLDEFLSICSYAILCVGLIEFVRLTSYDF